MGFLWEGEDSNADGGNNTPSVLTLSQTRTLHLY